jgi:hypothetical protein
MTRRVTVARALLVCVLMLQVRARAEGGPPPTAAPHRLTFRRGRPSCTQCASGARAQSSPSPPVFASNVAVGGTALGGALLVRRVPGAESSLQRRRLLSESDSESDSTSDDGDSVPGSDSESDSTSDDGDSVPGSDSESDSTSDDGDSVPGSDSESDSESDDGDSVPGSDNDTAPVPPGEYPQTAGCSNSFLHCSRASVRPFTEAQCALRPGSVFQVTQGPCATDGNCFTSANYPSNYGNFELCTIVVDTNETLWVQSFATEEDYDVLTVDGVDYSGSGDGLDGLVVRAGDIITWCSDSNVNFAGFSVCSGGTCPARHTFSASSHPVRSCCVC